MNVSNAGGEPMDVMPMDGDAQRERSSWGCWKIAGVGCLGVLAVTIVGCVVGGWYIYRNGVRLAAPLARTFAQQALNDAELPQEEKDAIMVQVDRLVTAAEQDRVNMNDLQKALDSISKSPLFAAGMVSAADVKYVQPSGLSNEEKQDATRVLQRVLHGLYDKAITIEQLEPVQSFLFVDDGKGAKRLKEQLTDEELRQFIAGCREIVDKADVADEPFEITISQELKEVVDDLLGEPEPLADPEPSLELEPAVEN
ncbi:MAG: hypothetical protein O2931_13820 [Planctomycetota bacterium]|nr:hypothetical protein [Planctomycetota bacterium]MDA1179863.1 hypothetical protein [Planctomycetota bacterium]